MNQLSVSLPFANKMVPKSLSNKPVRVCFKSNKNLRLSSLTLMDCLSITVPLDEDAVRGRMLVALVGD